MDPLLLILLVVSIAVAVGNNMGVISGPTSGSRILKESSMMILAFTGLTLGYLVEGGKMGLGISVGYWDVVIIFLLAIGTLSLLTFWGFITSITQIFVGIFTGYLLAKGVPGSASAIGEIFLFWVVTFAASVIMSYLFVRGVAKKGRRALVNNLATLKVISIVMVFLSAYILGANTLGFVAGFLRESIPYPYLQVGVVAGIAVGILIIKGSRGARKLGSGFYGMKYLSTIAPYISTLILTEIGTQLSIPLPMSIAIFSGVIGTASGMRIRLISPKKVGMYIGLSWVLPLLGTFLISYIIFLLL